MTAPDLPNALILPDDIKNVVRTFAQRTATTRRELAYALRDFMTEVPHGAKMQVYELVAHEWNDATGDHVTARTVRFWMQSIVVYTREDMQTLHPLSDAQLIEAVNLATIANTTPLEVCEWAVKEHCDSVPAMRAHWMPQTSTDYEIDPPYISALKRSASKIMPTGDSRWHRFNELVRELRDLLKTK